MNEELEKHLFENDVSRISNNIVQLINFFVPQILWSKGYKEVEEKQVMQAIFTNFTINLDEHTNKNKARQAIGMSSCSFYQNISVKRSATQQPSSSNKV